MTEVGDLLRRSMALHVQAKASKQGRPADAQDKWTQAYALRYQAHGRDPHHTDPAWEEEQNRSPAGRDTHVEMMSFYRSKGLTKPPPAPGPDELQCFHDAEPAPIEPPRDEDKPKPDHPKHEPVVEQPQPETRAIPSIEGTYETFATHAESESAAIGYPYLPISPEAERLMEPYREALRSSQGGEYKITGTLKPIRKRKPRAKTKAKK